MSYHLILMIASNLLSPVLCQSRFVGFSRQEAHDSTDLREHRLAAHLTLLFV